LFLLPHKEVIFFDLEYTDSSLADAAGVLPEIIEIGAIKVTSELLIKDRFEALVQPPRLDRFTNFCYSLTGIKIIDLEKSLPFEKVWNDFARFTEYAKLPLLSWGVESDIPVLKYSYLKRNLGYPHSKIVIDIKSVIWAFAAINNLDIGGWSLRTACKYFGVKCVQKHRALSDSMAMLSLLNEIDKFDGEEEYQLIEI